MRIFQHEHSPFTPIFPSGPSPHSLTEDLVRGDRSSYSILPPNTNRINLFFIDGGKAYPIYSNGLRTWERRC